MSIKNQNLDNLSTYELHDLIITRFSLALDQMSIPITLIFAYFTVAYVVGKTLSKLQLYAITTVYSFFVLSLFLVSVKLWMVADELFIYRDGVGHLVHMMTAPASIFLGWALSIVFMIDCRNKNKNKNKL
jgi:hypothetical protein